MALFARPTADTFRRRKAEGGTPVEGKERLVPGMRQVQRLLNAGQAARILLAQDADERLRHSLTEAAKAAGVPVESCESMAVLGRRCRIAVPCAVAAETAD